MLSKCANPQCTARMKYMHDGSVYVVPKRAIDLSASTEKSEFSAPNGVQIECFWLCQACCQYLTISNRGAISWKDGFSPSQHRDSAYAAM